MAKFFSPEIVTGALVSIYDKVTGDVPLIGSAYDLAMSYHKPTHPVANNIDSLIRWQCAKSAGTGFITNLPGGLAALGTIPTDLATTLVIQLRMIAAIGHLSGFDIRSDQTRTLAFLCLCGKGVHKFCETNGIKLTELILKRAINALPSQALAAINKKVGARIFTKWGGKGIINFGKMIPLAGGIFGGAFNLASTRAIGATAKKLFLS